jgi:hypothetical protein
MDKSAAQDRHSTGCAVMQLAGSLLSYALVVSSFYVLVAQANELDVL